MTPDFTALRAKYRDRLEITIPIGALSEQMRNYRNSNDDEQRKRLLRAMDYTSNKLKQNLAALNGAAQ